jgi:hypothetical protein
VIRSVSGQLPIAPRPVSTEVAARATGCFRFPPAAGSEPGVFWTAAVDAAAACCLGHHGRHSDLLSCCACIMRAGVNPRATSIAAAAAAAAASPADLGGLYIGAGAATSLPPRGFGDGADDLHAWHRLEAVPGPHSTAQLFFSPPIRRSSLSSRHGRGGLVSPRRPVNPEGAEFTQALKLRRRHIHRAGRNQQHNPFQQLVYTLLFLASAPV